MKRALVFFFVLFVTTNMFGQKHSTRINDTVSLIKYVEPILFETYGKEHILAEKPYIVFFKEGIWIADGSLPDRFTKGGTFHIEVRARDGKVIKIIHYK